MFNSKLVTGIRTAGAVLIIASIVMLGACKSGGSHGGSGAFARRALPAEFSTRKAVAYSGFRGPTRETEPTNLEILEDLQLLHSKGYGLLRFFGADPVIQRTLQVMRDHPELDMKCQLGIWISGSDALFHAANQAAMDEGIAVANNPAFKHLILTVSVGNETMIDWSMHVAPEDIQVYIKYVRDRVKQPVTTDDNWAFFTGQNVSHTITFNTPVILDNIDFVSMHTYAILDTPYGLWDWKQEAVPEGPARAVAMMDAAMVWTKLNFSSVKDYLDAHGYNMPIIIGETGWKARPTNGEYYRAHPVNQKMYIDRLDAWNALPKDGSVPVNIFYFEAFDETWKGGDDGWGLWNVGRKERYVIWGSDVSKQEALAAAPDDDAEYYIAPVPNGTITANKYIVYSETVDALNDAQPVGGTRWDAWDGNTVVLADSSDAAEGSQSKEITPVPKVWGWGLAFSAVNPDDLSNFGATANLNLSIKTTYPGKLEIGFQTGLTSNGDAVDVYLPIESGEYGFVNDGNWHQVSIPIDTIKTHAAPAFGMPGTATLNMANVASPFVIADRYGVTGNATASTNKIYIDNIYWSK